MALCGSWMPRHRVEQESHSCTRFFVSLAIRRIWRVPRGDRTAIIGTRVEVSRDEFDRILREVAGSQDEIKVRFADGTATIYSEGC